MSAADSPGIRADNSPPEASEPMPNQASSCRPRRAGDRLRFIQSSDFRLDTPCFGVPGLPERCRDCFVDARYIAAERVFNAAIQHDVDFVILAGGLLDPRLPGLRGPWFLAEQFRRLADHAIDVYWAGATFETRGRWPAYADLPTNVHWMTANDTGILHGRHGQPIARLLTLAEGSERQRGDNGPFTIAIQPRCDSVPEQWETGVSFWALGGQAEQETVQVGDVVAHFAGSPQGRSPAEVGRHSCSLIDVGADGAVKIHPVLTDVARWHRQQLDIQSDLSWSSLERKLTERLAELRQETHVDLNLVHWTVTGGGLTLQRLLEPRFKAELINRLNAAQSKQSPVVWTSDIEAHVDARQRSDWQARPAPLGTFLRELEELTPHIDELFGASMMGSHSPGVCAVETREQLIRQVVNEGVHSFGVEDALKETAG